MSLPDLPAVITRLSVARVEFIVVGGVAAAVHGSAHVTYDLDLVYRRTAENIERLSAALGPLRPYLRGAPAGLPFAFDPPTISRGLNFTLSTSLGDLDLLGEIAGDGTYERLLPDTIAAAIDGVEFRCVSLRRLILLKRAAGRPRDLAVVGELEALLDEQDRGGAD